MATPRPTGGRKRKNAGTAHYQAKFSDELRALIWTLTEEGCSQREVAKRLDIATSSVGNELATDDIRLGALRARQRETRALNWKKLEDVSVKEALEWVSILSKNRFGFNATGKSQISQRKLERIAIIPRILTGLKNVAGEGSKQVQLLTGGVTERRGEETTEINAEQLVAEAIARGCVDRLPPRLRAYAEEQVKKGAKS